MQHVSTDDHNDARAVRTIRHRVVIEAPRERVWAALADLEGFAEFSPMVRSSTLLSDQQRGVGAVRRCDAVRPGHIDERVVRWDVGRLLALEVVGGMPIRGVGTWELEGDGPTTVVFELEYRPRFGPLGAMLDAVMLRREMDRGFAANLDGLRRLVEGDCDPSSEERQA